MDDLAERLDLIIAVVEGARAMPLSTSCLINRAELLEALEDLRARLPGRLADAERILADSDAIIDDAHRRAAAIVADGRREGARLASGSAVVRQAEADAAAIVTAARQASDDMRGQIDSYVDGKLAGFEELLGRTLSSVTRGRERLATRGAVAMAKAGGQSGRPVSVGASAPMAAPAPASVAASVAVAVAGPSGGPGRRPDADPDFRDSAGPVDVPYGVTAAHPGEYDVGPHDPGAYPGAFGPGAYDLHPPARDDSGHGGGEHGGGEHGGREHDGPGYDRLDHDGSAGPAGHVRLTTGASAGAPIG